MAWWQSCYKRPAAVQDDLLTCCSARRPASCSLGGDVASAAVDHLSQHAAELKISRGSIAMSSLGDALGDSHNHIATMVAPVCCIGWLVCLVGSATTSSTCLVALACCSAPALIIWANHKPSTNMTQSPSRSREQVGSQVLHSSQNAAATEASLPQLRPQPSEVEAARRRGEDPYAGQRLNYLQGTSIPFDPLLHELEEDQRSKFETFEREFPRALASCGELDRTRFYQEPDRFTLLLFLQADAYDVEKATRRLLKAIVWRQASGFEDFVDDPDLDALRLYEKLRPRRIVGFDRLGRPLTVEPLGEFFGSDNGCSAMSMRKWLLCYAFDVSLQQMAFRKASIRLGRAQHRVAYIGDLSGLRLRQAKDMIGFLRELTKQVETHFPECVGTVVLINAPFFFQAVFSLATRFLDPKTCSRVSVHTGTPHGFLKETFGSEALPVELGGRLQFRLPHVQPLSEVLSEIGLDGPLKD